MGNAMSRDIHCDVTMSNGIDMCTYHGIIYMCVCVCMCVKASLIEI